MTSRRTPRPEGYPKGYPEGRSWSTPLEDSLEDTSVKVPEGHSLRSPPKKIPLEDPLEGALPEDTSGVHPWRGESSRFFN
jgi:hypothetical protein